jgi:hypothetical protein
MREVFLLLVAAFLSMQEPCMARVVCDESGWNEFGTWSTCLKYHRESGAREGRRPVDASRVGKVEKVHKNLDGSVTVWRHGSTDTEEWTQTDADTWERKR